MTKANQPTINTNNTNTQQQTHNKQGEEGVASLARRMYARIGAPPPRRARRAGAHFFWMCASVRRPGAGEGTGGRGFGAAAAAAAAGRAVDR